MNKPQPQTGPEIEEYSTTATPKAPSWPSTPRPRSLKPTPTASLCSAPTTPSSR